jgi:hypothetical protein
MWCGWLPDAPAATLVMDGLHRSIKLAVRYRATVGIAAINEWL